MVIIEPYYLAHEDTPQLDPEVLKEISKWATVQIEKRKQPSHDIKFPESATLIRVEQDEKNEIIMRENSRIEGRATEDRIIELFTLIRYL